MRQDHEIFFGLSFCQCCIKPYAVGILELPGETILKDTQKTCFYGELLKIIPFYHFNTNPKFPHFPYMYGANLGLLEYFCIEMVLSVSLTT